MNRLTNVLEGDCTSLPAGNMLGIRPTGTSDVKQKGSRPQPGSRLQKELSQFDIEQPDDIAWKVLTEVLQRDRPDRGASIQT